MYRLTLKGYQGLNGIPLGSVEDAGYPCADGLSDSPLQASFRLGHTDMGLCTRCRAPSSGMRTCDGGGHTTMHSQMVLLPGLQYRAPCLHPCMNDQMSSSAANWRDNYKPVSKAMACVICDSKLHRPQLKPTQVRTDEMAH